MDDNGAVGRSLRVGGLEFDPRSRSIVVDGHETLLDSRSSRVLLALVQRLGQRVSKDELLSAGWPGQVVHENSLAKAVSRLRGVIRGSGVEIAVSYGAGYVLRECADGADLRAASATAEYGLPAPDERRSSFRIGMAFALVGTFLAIVAGFYISRLAHPPQAAREIPLITHDAPNTAATVLWVDDHPSNNLLEAENLKRHRIAVHLAESTDDALKLLAMNSYQLVISDLGRGEDRLAGLRMIDDMKNRGIEVPVIIYTVRPQGAARQAAQRRLVLGAGATDLAVTPQEVLAKALARVAPGR